MKRQEQIEKAATAKSRGETPYYYEAFVEGAERADAHPHWISVEDELPPKESEYDDNSIGIVVLATDGNGVYEGLYQSNEYLSGWFTHDLWALDNITHWMPLPPPPKKGGEV